MNLSSFNLAEALAWLRQQTGRAWTDSELFDFCVSREVPVHAAPPLEARCSVVELDPKNPSGVRVVMHLSWRKAILYPFNVGQLWQVGETEPTPVWHPMHPGDERRWAVFDPPVRVRREHLAIALSTLNRIVKEWCTPAQWRHGDGTPVDTATEAAPATKQTDLPDWKMRVQAEAAQEWRRLRAMGCNPTVASIAPIMARWCISNNVLTKTGINPRERYLREHVLGGKHWSPPR